MAKYTTEKNIEMLISLLKQYNIKRVIVSPGAMNVSFVGSIQSDDFFEIYSCVDERSACYMACGLAEETGEPVAISCTGATASRNYLPGLTEAYYRKLPVLAITASQFHGNVGHNIPQMINRFATLNDVVKVSVQAPLISTVDDEWHCNIQINKALQALTQDGRGPVHINMETGYCAGLQEKELTVARKIDFYTEGDTLPKMVASRIGIFVGAHSKWDDDFMSAVDEFCEKYGAVVLCDRTSNYFGKYKVMPNIVCDQDNYVSELNHFDLIIHLGNISGAYMKLNMAKVWRVGIDGEMIDTFRKLDAVFCMNEVNFFKKYNSLKQTKARTSFKKDWTEECSYIAKKAKECDLPFSNIWIARELAGKMPKNSVMHFGILNSLRAWNYFDDNQKINGYSNTGGFGIDGIPSTIIGASLANKDKIYYGVLGDLAFFYDMNSLGNRDIGNNVRLLIINNGCGTEFHNYSHAARGIGVDVSQYVAADGHFANKSQCLVKDYAEDLGFEYISARNKDEFLAEYKKFISDDERNRSMIFEVFTDADDESDALKIIRNLEVSKKTRVRNELKQKSKKIISPDMRQKIKTIMRSS